MIWCLGHVIDLVHLSPMSGLIHHWLEKADRPCDCVAIIDVGQIIAMDTRCELKSQIGPPEQVTLEDVFLKLTG